jgi:hypothetical protein
MALNGNQRSGRGVTTSASLTGRGPRCHVCGEWKDVVWRNVYGQDVCLDCGGEAINDGLIERVSGPSGQTVRGVPVESKDGA